MIMPKREPVARRVAAAPLSPPPGCDRTSLQASARLVVRASRGNRSPRRTRPRGSRARPRPARDTGLRQTRCAPASAGVRRLRIDERVQPACRAARRSAPPASCCSARRAPRTSSASISTTIAGDCRHQLVRRALADQPAAVEDREPRGSARPRPCSASTPGSSCRGSTRTNSALPEIARGSADRPRSSARRGNSSSGRCSVAAGEREPLALAAAHRARALRQQLRELELRGDSGDARARAQRAPGRRSRARNSRFSRTVRSSQSENFCVM